MCTRCSHARAVTDASTTRVRKMSQRRSPKTAATHTTVSGMRRREAPRPARSRMTSRSWKGSSPTQPPPSARRNFFGYDPGVGIQPLDLRQPEALAGHLVAATLVATLVCGGLEALAVGALPVWTGVRRRELTAVTDGVRLGRVRR